MTQPLRAGVSRGGSSATGFSLRNLTVVSKFEQLVTRLSTESTRGFAPGTAHPAAQRNRTPIRKQGAKLRKTDKKTGATGVAPAFLKILVAAASFEDRPPLN